MSEFVGSWDLIRYAHTVGEIPNEDDGSAIHAWLQGSDKGSLGSDTERTGLQLSIEGESFSEQVSAFSSLMFDVEGVQVNDYQPMSGKILVINGLGFLMPEGVPEYALPINVAFPLRYDDGDTKVCDTVRVFDDVLVRQLSVVTDELYLDRMTLLYYRGQDIA
ncbi:hypothetical protein [Crateriforma conspicua]|uniref:DUF1579 domain-containing protein n=1 Tax=Crateriforma conspicua TaxID=2527996 RepID=A0A5C5YAA6_9PLAN|nr:hypothetical protein [Crateriforma conspicua]TWT72626.1 hypothetical protein Pan14r_49460 [Crateriforma conspicua]